uniref:Uncharacterized protein n=1 Tax=Sander lucioperca TaxID=283035 RepID=A0A8C9Z2Q7_SANLU
MKCQLVLPACLLLLWTLTVYVGLWGQPNITFNEQYMDKPVPYDDVYTGEYTCISADNKEESKIYVKFRTCNNCIELDVPSIVGIVIGNVAATIVIGVAVYLTASQNRIGPNTVYPLPLCDYHILKKNEMINKSFGLYPTVPQRLQHHQKDEYDKLNNRK